MSRFIGSIDQGTTSSRFIIFDHQGNIIAMDQREHRQIYPKAGWVEHDAQEIWQNTQKTVARALEKANIDASDIAAVGITNQRETTLLWDRKTGEPLHNALVWMDTRTDRLVEQFSKDEGPDRLRNTTGLPISTYFSGLKLRWLLDNVPRAREKAKAGDALFGTIDSWLIWNLTGGPNGGIHITDVTNASRTQLMDLKTLQWDENILKLFGIPAACLPEIRSSSEVYTEISIPMLKGVKLAGILGDQQAALFGQACLQTGEAKNTYGTGCFMLMNTGEKLVPSTCGLITTIAYQLGDARPIYALEGSIAITGALVQWLRDNLGIIEKSSDIEKLARTVEDNGDVYFVPAFSGLYAPHWEQSARGIIAGLTGFSNKGHIARAALEASCYQVREVLEAMVQDSGIEITELRTDGGMTVNDLMMQFQSDIIDVPVVRPKIIETTALGAAYAAGLAVQFWKSTDDISENWQMSKRWEPKMEEIERERLFNSWGKAIRRSLRWTDA
ncbi:glycerol kinase GlpK [Falsochrobactrum ovis]|uniref:Glycerol kinase n=2 Tax=Falsochrobactrum ovis TaxID=1293442 RepID=A0A364JWG2_9HYPH|nr:glycerol kinase GlpK [Falsochrobactrum ovis]RAK30078.1 glycerol kinase [Falsochrobactrum ovis]